MVEKRVDCDDLDPEIEKGMCEAGWGDEEDDLEEHARLLSEADDFLKAQSLVGFGCPNPLCPGFLEGYEKGGFICNVCQQKIADFSDWQKRAGEEKNG